MRFPAQTAVCPVLGVGAFTVEVEAHESVAGL
jgi:hypothetical protein